MTQIDITENSIIKTFHLSAVLQTLYICTEKTGCHGWIIYFILISTSPPHHLVQGAVPAVWLLGEGRGEHHPVEDHHGQAEVEREGELGEQGGASLLSVFFKNI